VTFYDLAANGASIEELNQTIHSLNKAQTFNMPLLISGEVEQRQNLDEYKFADFWTRISTGGLQRRLGGLRMEWGHKLSTFDQFMNVAWGMVLLLRERDPYTAIHSVYVAMCAFLIGEKMGMSPLELEFLKIGGIYHDVGKIGIRDEVLRKPDQLSEKEFKHMRQHPLKGLQATQLLTQGMDEWDGWAHSLQGVERGHHLRYDGKGYPSTTKHPDDVSLFTWIIGMADALDAMTTMRSYTKGNPRLEEKIRDIESNKGKQFHPLVAEACLALLEEGISVKARFPLPSIGAI
jgi:HD-GYP domain-containing protein (c-di-GMP phosphodiesterase class II)